MRTVETSSSGRSRLATDESTPWSLRIMMPHEETPSTALACSMMTWIVRSRSRLAVTASLDLERTIHVIMEQARAVLGVSSCGIMMRNDQGVLSSVASLDLPEELVSTVRIHEG